MGGCWVGIGAGVGAAAGPAPIETVPGRMIAGGTTGISAKRVISSITACAIASHIASMVPSGPALILPLLVALLRIAAESRDALSAMCFLSGLLLGLSDVRDFEVQDYPIMLVLTLHWNVATSGVRGGSRRLSLMPSRTALSIASRNVSPATVSSPPPIHLNFHSICHLTWPSGPRRSTAPRPSRSSRRRGRCTFRSTSTRPSRSPCR